MTIETTTVSISESSTHADRMEAWADGECIASWSTGCSDPADVETDYDLSVEVRQHLLDVPLAAPVVLGEILGETTIPSLG